MKSTHTYNNVHTCVFRSTRLYVLSCTLFWNSTANYSTQSRTDYKHKDWPGLHHCTKQLFWLVKWVPERFKGREKNPVQFPISSPPPFSSDHWVSTPLTHTLAANVVFISHHTTIANTLPSTHCPTLPTDTTQGREFQGLFACILIGMMHIQV